MSLLVKHRPKTFSEFVGAETRREALSLVKQRIASWKVAIKDGRQCSDWNRRVIALTAPKGCGKTNGLGRLFMKSHFCTEGADGGPCGTCETCLYFEESFDNGMGYISVPKLPSRTPTTRQHDEYFFKVYDLANITAAQIDYIRWEIAPSPPTQTPNPALSAAFFTKHPEVVMLDEAQRADKPKQNSLLTALDGRLLSTVILCVPTVDLARLDVGLRRRPYTLQIVAPEFGELVAYIEAIAEKESIKIAEKSAVIDMAQGCGGIPSNVLLLLDLAQVQGIPITSAWVMKTLPRLPPPDKLEEPLAAALPGSVVAV